MDKRIVDRVVNWTGKFSLLTGSQVRRLQSGYTGFYLLAMVLGIVVLFFYAFIIR